MAIAHKPFNRSYTHSAFSFQLKKVLSVHVNIPFLFTNFVLAVVVVDEFECLRSLVIIYRMEELTCGGLTSQVRSAFGETLTTVVRICTRFPVASASSIGLLCTLPFTK